MKHTLHKLCSIGCLAFAAASSFATSEGTSSPHISMSQNSMVWHSLHNNASAELARTQGHHRKHDEGFQTHVAITGSYNQNMRGSLSKYGAGSLPFWSGSNRMIVTQKYNNSYDWQTGTTTREANGHISGRSLGFEEQNQATGYVELDPKISQISVIASGYFGAPCNETGVWASIKAPFGIQYMNPNLSSDVTFPADSMYATLEEAWAGGGKHVTPSEANPAGAGQTALGLTHGKVAGKQNSGARLGDVALTLGGNIVADDTKLLALGVRASVPFGNKQTGEYVLEPIFGSGKHFKLGVEALSSWNLVDQEDRSLNLSVFGYAQHIFTNTSKRSFDSKRNGIGSKYVHVGKFNADATNIQNTEIDNRIVQNLVNISTVDVHSSYDLEGSIAAQLNYTINNFTITAGCELVGRTEEKLKLKNSDFLDDALYVTIGDHAYIYDNFGKHASLTYNGQLESGRSIYYKTYHVDSAATAIDGATHSGGGGGAVGNDVTTGSFRDNRYEDFQAGVRDAAVGLDDFDLERAASKAALSNRLFASLAYEWADNDMHPHVAIHASCTRSMRANNGLNHWQMSIQGGLSF